MNEDLHGPYAGLGWSFVVECNDSTLSRHVARTLRPLRADIVPAGRYTITAPTGAANGVLALDGTVLYRSLDPWLLFARMLWHINMQVVSESREHVLLHAAAAEEDGRAVILCAPMEAGKTTLVAGLVQAGLNYLTDETVAIDPQSGFLKPFPKALSIDRGSWGVLGSLAPSSEDDGLGLSVDQWQVTAEDIRPGATSTGGAPALIVLPQYAPDGPTTLTRISPGTALLALLEQTFRLEMQRARDMACLSALVNRCPAFRLSVSDLATAVNLVRQQLQAA